MHTESGGVVYLIAIKVPQLLDWERKHVGWELSRLHQFDSESD